MTSPTTRIDLARFQMVQPTDSTHSNSTIPYTLPPVTTSPPDTSVLGKHGRGSETSLETGDKGEDGAAYRHAFGLRTDFDVPKQVSPFRVRTTDIEIAQPMHTDGRAYWARTIMPFTHTSSTRSPQNMYNSAIRRYCTSQSLQFIQWTVLNSI